MRTPPVRRSLPNHRTTPAITRLRAPNGERLMARWSSEFGLPEQPIAARLERVGPLLMKVYVLEHFLTRPHPVVKSYFYRARCTVNRGQLEQATTE